MNQWEDDTWTKEPLRIIWGLWESHDNKFSVSNKKTAIQIYEGRINCISSQYTQLHQIKIFPKSCLFIMLLFICKTHTCQVHTDQWLLRDHHIWVPNILDDLLKLDQYKKKKKKKIKQWPINEINHRKSSQEKECLFKWYSLDTQCRKCPICPGTSVSSLLIAHPHYSHCMSRWIRKESP